jgi:hypothetical protein
LQIMLEVGRTGVRKALRDVTEARLRAVLSWTHEIGVPVLPLSAAEDTAPQIRRLLGRLPSHQGRGGRSNSPEAALG